MAVVMIFLPRRLLASAAPIRLMLLDSVAPEVKYSSCSVQPSTAAIAFFRRCNVLFRFKAFPVQRSRVAVIGLHNLYGRSDSWFADLGGRAVVQVDLSYLMFAHTMVSRPLDYGILVK